MCVCAVKSVSVLSCVGRYISSLHALIRLPPLCMYVCVCMYMYAVHSLRMPCCWHVSMCRKHCSVCTALACCVCVRGPFGVRTYVCVTLHPVWETFCHDTLTHCWNCLASESALLAIFSVKTRLAVAPPKLVPGTPHALPVRETATVCGVRQNNGVCSLSTILRYSLLDSAWDG